MFELSTQGADDKRQRLTAGEALTSSDFDELALRLGAKIAMARKVGFVAARQASEQQLIETLWNGKESQITAEPGDWIVANLAPDLTILRDDSGNANIYAIRTEKFPALYKRHEGDNQFGEIYRAISQVECLYLSGGFEIMAPWGEVQRADSGYILRNGDDIYGNHKETFDATYEMVG